ncbi:hypothetical protein GCM10022221_37900 [Actinocorallia aurea]
MKTITHRASTILALWITLAGCSGNEVNACLGAPGGTVEVPGDIWPDSANATQATAVLCVDSNCQMTNLWPLNGQSKGLIVYTDGLTGPGPVDVSLKISSNGNTTFSGGVSTIPKAVAENQKGCEGSYQFFLKAAGAGSLIS